MDPSGRFNDSKIILVGYSLGSVILYELLLGYPFRPTNVAVNNVHNKIKFHVDYFFLMGSSLPAFLLLDDSTRLSRRFHIPKGVKLFNIIHPFDPVGFRLEPLIYPDEKDISPPILLPYWKTNGLRDWHSWDHNLKQAKSVMMSHLENITASLSQTWKWWLDPPTSKKIIDSTNSPILLDEGNDQEDNSPTTYSSEVSKLFEDSHDKLTEVEARIRLDKYNFVNQKTHLRRYDFQLQEDTTEHYLSPIAFLQSHFNYWKHHDVAFFMLRCLYDHNPIQSYPEFLKGIIEREKLAADECDKRGDSEECKNHLHLLEKTEILLENFNNKDKSTKKKNGYSSNRSKEQRETVM